jgi:hypothetical protein
MVMIDNRCKDCIWWDNTHISVTLIPVTEEKPNPGFCRKKRPGVILFKKHHMGVQPVMDAGEFCGEFKGEK